MNTTAKIIACGASALCAAVLSLQAQSTSSSSSSQQQQPDSSSSSSVTSPPRSSSSGSQRYDSSTSSGVSDINRQSDPTTAQRSYPTRNDSMDQSRSANTNSSSNTNQTIGQQSSTNTTISAQADTQVQTVVQQIDAQGPVVVERITTRFADATCTQENARALVEALHNGGSVTLHGQDGKSVTFSVNERLGYGDAYIAMALAVEALRNAGITGCATPEQWQTVLLGGQLSGGTVATTTVSTERFPGILTLHSQSHGWTQVAQTTKVELNQVVSNAHSSLDINTPTGDPSSRSGYRESYFNSSSDQQKKPKNEQEQQSPDKDKSNPPGNSNPGSGDNMGTTPRSDTPDVRTTSPGTGTDNPINSNSSGTTEPKPNP